MGNGERMVAVVQGTQDSALSVTLITTRQLKNSLKARRLPATRCTRETSTEYDKQNTSTQISDERYATTYQLAHCRLNPPALPQRPRELSPQRDDLTRNSRFTGYSASSSPSRQTDIFINSLRRYPLHPERSESAELVQRLLNYTQTKYLSRNSSRSMRSLHGTSPRRAKELGESRELSKSREIKDHTKSRKTNNHSETKDTETNCRILDGIVEPGSKTTRQSKESRESKKHVDHEADGKAHKKMQTYTRNITDNLIKMTKYKTGQLSESYNYLQAIRNGRRRYTSQHAELRYLNEIKRFLQDRLQLPSDENQAKCSTMVDRYNQHKKTCLQHKNDTNPNGPPCSNSLHQADEPSTSKGLPGHIYCKPPQDTQNFLLIKRMPCSCKICPRNDTAVLELAGDILNFLNKLSIYADEPPEIIAKRDEMIQQLAVKLINLKRQQGSDVRVKENIWKCMGYLPQWFPGTEHEWKMLKDLITDKILDESYNIASLKVDDSSKIEEVIQEWLRELPVYADNTLKSNEKREEIVKRLATNLNSLKNRADFDEKAKDKINICIDSLPKLFSSIERDKISNNLLNNLKNVMGILHDQSRAYNKNIDPTSKEIEEQTFEWLNQLPDYADETLQNKAKSKKMVKKLAVKLKNLKGCDNYEKMAKTEIDKCIESLPLRFPGNKREQEMFKNQITDNLLDNLNDDMCKSKSSEDVFDNEVEEQALEWLEELPFYTDETPKNKRQCKEIIKELAAKLNSLKGHDNFEERAKNEIDKYIESLPTWFSSAERDQIADNLLNNIKFTVRKQFGQRRAHRKKVDATDKEVEEQTLEWLNQLPDYADETPQNKAKNKEMVKELAVKLKRLNNRNNFEDKARDEIDKCIKSLTLTFPGTEEQQRKLKNQFVEKLLDNLNDILGKSNKGIHAFHRNIKEQTLEWLNELAVYGDETPQNKAKSQEIVTKLAAKLENLKGCDNYDNIAKNEIDKCIESLPLRFPGNKREQEMFKNQIANNLLDDLNDVMGKSISSEDVFDNEVEEQTLEWLYELPVFADETPQNKAKSKEMVTKLAATLKTLQGCDNYEKMAKTEIVKCIESLPLRFPGNKREQEILKNQIADNLLDDLNVIVKFNSREDVFGNELEEQTLGWLKKVPVFAGESPQNKAKSKEMVKELAVKLNSLKHRESFEDRAKDEIDKCIKRLPLSFPGSKRDQLTLQNQIAKDLLDDVNIALGISIDQRRVSNKIKDSEEEISEVQILDLLKGVCVYENLSQKNQEKIEKMAKELATKLKSLKGHKDFDKNTQAMIKKYIASVVSLISSDIAGNISDYSHIYESNNLKYTISKLDRSSASKNEANYTDNRVKDRILDWFNELPAYAGNSPQNKAKSEKIVKELANDLETLKDLADYDKRAKDKIRKCVESLPLRLSGTKHNQEALKKQIADNVFVIVDVDELKHPKDIFGKSVGHQRASKNGVDDTKNKVEKQILDRLKRLPAYANNSPQNKAKSEEIIKQLAYDLENLKGMDYFDKRAKDKIQICIESLPLSLPGNKQQQEVFKKQLTNNLFNIAGVDELKNQKSTLEKSLGYRNGSKKGVDDTNNKEKEVLKKHITNNLFDTVDVDELKNQNGTLGKSFGQRRESKKGVDDTNTTVEVQISEGNSKQEFTTSTPHKKRLFTFPNNDSIIKSAQPQNLHDEDEFNNSGEDEQTYLQINSAASTSKRVSKYENKEDQKENPNVVTEVEDLISKWTKVIHPKLASPVQKTQQKKTADVSSILIQDTKQFVAENLKGVILDWLKKQPLYTKRTPYEKLVQENLLNDLAEGLIVFFEESPTSETDTDELLVEEIIKHLKQFPLDLRYKSDQNYVKMLATQLLDYLKSSQIFEDISMRHDSQDHPRMNRDPFSDSVRTKKTDVSFEDSESWREKLPIDEHGRNIYKEKLREAISESLSFQELSSDEQLSFEVLKDEVADAFINLHYVGNNEEQRNKQKGKINYAINKYCNDYLKKHPTTPINRKKIIQDLYKALQKTLESDNKSFTSESDLAIPFTGPVTKKSADVPYDDIEDWCEKLPIDEHGRKIYKQQLSEAISKTLPFQELSADEEISFEVLKDDVANAFIDLHYVGNNEQQKKKHKKKINDAIDKYCNGYLKKHPTTPIDRKKLNQDLYTALKNTLEPNNKSFRNELELQQEPYEHYVVPPCALSAEDRAYLEKIRERSRLRILLRPVDSTSQTKIRCPGPGICAGLKTCPSLELYNKESIQQRNSGVQTSFHRTQAAGSQVDICPNVIVKEYYWDSVDTLMEPQTRTPSAPSPASCTHQPQNDIIISQRPFSPPLCHCPSQTQKEQPCSRYSTSPNQFKCAGSISRPMLEKRNLCHPARPYEGRYSGSRGSDQNLTRSQRYEPEEENRHTTPSASRSCIESPFSCSPHPSQDRSYAIPQSSIPQAGPCGSQRWIPCSSNSRQPWYVRQDVPSTLEKNEAGPSCFSRKSRVTHLGSFDHVEPTVKSRNWGKCPKNVNEFRNGSYTRYLPIDKDPDEPYLNKRHKKIENVRCRCTERILTKCSGRKIGRHNVSPVKNCGKCCGVHCPYPSYMFFKQ